MPARIDIDALKLGQSVPFESEYTLSFICQSDLADIIETLHDEKVITFLHFAPSPDSLYEAYFQPIIDNTASQIECGEWPDTPTFTIRDIDGKYMGMTGLQPVVFLEGNYEIGYQFARHAWGKGLATAACRFATAFAFEKLHAHKVTADCYAGNTGSSRVLEKAGFRCEGAQKGYYRIHKGFDDRLIYGMTGEQFAMLGE
ncbi:GNAT family N-acetyltransferase [Parasalinivibrio latis]|uniref:GNAT family N-acetyltransferase n=1 Tax=Parasalinivibrio latis TaxID=2952610 RepID=UPI0030E24A99